MSDGNTAGEPGALVEMGDWHSGAVFTACMKYRVKLWRRWNQTLPMLMFLLLNPSTADDLQNDATVERCQRRAMAMGYGGLYIGNIFALRSTDPAALYVAEDPVGAANDAALIEMAKDAANVIFGCGNHGALKRRAVEVLALLEPLDKPLMALAVNGTGYPKHPLYVAYETQPRLWDGYGLRLRGRA